jgi:hypothetical protein
MMITGTNGDYKTRTDGHFVLQSGERERRSGVERRRFLYDAHIPERRRQVDRRNGAGRESINDVATVC